MRYIGEGVVTSNLISLAVDGARNKLMCGVDGSQPDPQLYLFALDTGNLIMSFGCSIEGPPPHLGGVYVRVSL